ncbi:hypothetical protein [Cellulophaga sp. Z1A5H]|uniref:hypothetical protein n=1 Tax=Cellulophaga sp. Z1A5H TaxID=2687291 RepID=UPI0013FD3D67|nr:hypothetical protein [Cellulophaga sp. Z1A5H]
MKKALLILFLFCFNTILLGQANFYGFQVSPKYKLTTVDSTLLISDISENKKTSIFLIDHKGNKLKEFKVYPRQYKPGLGISYVSEISRYEPKLSLKDINNIVTVQIVQCNIICKYTIYYWLINTKNEWIELPVIEYSYEEENAIKDYYFQYDMTNQIRLDKYKMVESTSGKTGFTAQEFQCTLKYLNWDGITLSEE